MKIKRLKINNFRLLENFDIDLKNTTVIIGENNTGKTALLESIRLALAHRWGVRGTGFQEYDFHLSKDIPEPKQSKGINIEIYICEDIPNEWSDDLKADLESIIQIDPLSNIRSITLQCEYKFEKITETFEPTWCFLNRKGQLVTKKSSRATNLSPFFSYMPTFFLSPIRDAAQEFTGRSQFWGKLIKSIKIDENDWNKISDELDTLNKKFIASDSKFSNIKRQIEQIKSVISGSVDSIDIRALPLRLLDLLAKTELMVKSNTEDPWLPLSCFGQGTQSLAVLNVFQAFIKNLVSEDSEKDTAPILLLEEPEAHLHPQAARALFDEIDKYEGQKLITTHSPHFLQNVPFQNIRLIRKVDTKIRLYYLKEDFRVSLPLNDKLNAFIAGHSEKFSYEKTIDELKSNERVSEDEYKKLLACFTIKEERDKFHPLIKNFVNESLCFMDRTELLVLEDTAKRIRGEILFARKWILCEGQSDHILLNAFIDILDYPLDINGISVIDCKNNGSAGSFAALARAFGFPWIILCDDDKGGEDLLRNIKSYYFKDSFIKKRTVQPQNYQDMETHLVEHLDTRLLMDILVEINMADAGSTFTKIQLADLLRKNKVAYAVKLREKIRDGQIKKENIPPVFHEVISKIREIEHQ